MMNSIIIHKSASRSRPAHTVSTYEARIIRFYTLAYQDLRQRNQSRLSIDQLEDNLVPEKAAVDEGKIKPSGNDSTVTAKAQIQDDPKAELSIVESAPTEIINMIFNNLLEKEFPDICSALCFGLTSRRNWGIFRNLDHTSYLKEHMDHIPSIIYFKYDKIPLFNPYHEHTRSFYGDGESIVYDYLFSPYFLDDTVNINRYLKPSQHKQLMLFKEWMGPKYRPPTSLIIPYYLSCAVYGERDGKNVEEEILIKRYYDSMHYQVFNYGCPARLD
ncbi:hypothetical protein BOTCAL_0654g00030 [Botryotinia calthae]|uniref:Uncharacterized protein n=1 Tax=Botryotinia calthae TaxID=38488 RepID=A0A4Y8CK15_9HELO|nr:hypothetical protein BOTCAL_0654g00030 [Botryotinia calthae]